jgi:hypothetical protein
MLTKLTAATAAAALLVTPTLVSAQTVNPAASLSVAKSARAAAPTRGVSKAGGGAGSVGVYLVGAALLVGFGFLVVKNADNDDDSDSN